MFDQKNKNTIKDIVLAVTYECDSYCAYCNNWKNRENFSLWPADFKNLPSELETINLSGGEPFLRKDLARIIRAISFRCPQADIVISTNGFSPCLIKRNFEEILKFKRDIGVAVLLDAIGRKHDKLRRVRGGYALALETLRLLKETGLSNLKIAFTLTDANISELKKVYRLSRELGVEFSLSLAHNIWHFSRREHGKVKQVQVIKKELAWLVEQEIKGLNPKRWPKAYFAYLMIQYLETGQKSLLDYSGIFSLFINPFGNIYPSNVWNLEMGKLQRIRSWPLFYKRAQKLIESHQKERPAAYTASQAMKEQWFKGFFWIIKRKFFYYLTKSRRMFDLLDQKSLPEKARS